MEKKRFFFETLFNKRKELQASSGEIMLVNTERSVFDAASWETDLQSPIFIPHGESWVVLFHEGDNSALYFNKCDDFWYVLEIPDLETFLRKRQAVTDQIVDWDDGEHPILCVVVMPCG